MQNSREIALLIHSNNVEEVSCDEFQVSGFVIPSRNFQFLLEIYISAPTLLLVFPVVNEEEALAVEKTYIGDVL